MMDGIWIKLCPQCGSYIRKNDPAIPAVCTVCGWQGTGKRFLLRHDEFILLDSAPL